MKYADLISKMTLEEKCSLLSGRDNFSTKPVERLGIPSMYLSDGPHGLRKQTGAADHLGLNASLPATCFPTAATIANTWDTELGESLGQMLGEEAVAQGVSVLLGPGLNMKRSPLCGRNFEYFSEDPYLAGKMAAAYIRGIQSKGIAACPKHFAANNQETQRMHSDSVVDERTLREIYLTAFEIAVKEAHPLSLMTSYNRLNGTYTNSDKRLLQDILVNEWGFDGFIVTDWGGSDDRVEGLIAGNSLEMPATAGNSDREVAEAVQSGRLSEQVIDQRVDEYLRVLFATEIPKDAPKEFNTKLHHDFARKAAEESIVLLKNENGLLPLKAGTRVAVIGDFAATPRYQGAGSSLVNPTMLDNAFDSLKHSSLDILGYEPGFIRNGTLDEGRKSAAVALAQKAEVVLLFLGLDEIAECEGMDRQDMKLRPCQAAVLEAVSQANPNTVVILAGGSPIETPWLGQCMAVLHGYLGGQAGAGAVADVLTGTVNPSGKLAETWPISYGDTPAYRHFPGRERTVEYREGPFIGYRYYQTAGVPVRFPFGYGLSYTSFSYSALEASQQAVCLTLENTGQVAGAEVVQVYIGLEDSALFRPVRELKGFTKVFLQPGEIKEITIPLDDKAFRYFNPKTCRFEVEGGRYKVMAGASSMDIRLSAELEVAGAQAPAAYDPAVLPSYYSGKVQDVSDQEFAALLGRPIPDAKWDRTRPLGRNDTVAQLSYAKSGAARLAYRFLAGKKQKAEDSGTPDLNILFMYNIPFRGIAKMMGGAVDMAMVDALLTVINGHFWRGLGQLAGAWRRMRRARRATGKRLVAADKEGRL